MPLSGLFSSSCVAGAESVADIPAPEGLPPPSPPTIAVFRPSSFLAACSCPLDKPTISSGFFIPRLSRIYRPSHSGSSRHSFLRFTRFAHRPSETSAVATSRRCRTQAHYGQHRLGVTEAARPACNQPGPDSEPIQAPVLKRDNVFYRVRSQEA
jgi:hypothetical protein